MKSRCSRARPVEVLCLLASLVGGEVFAQSLGRHPVQALQAGVYVHADVEAWSNGMPVLDLNGDWGHGYEQRSGPQRAYVQGRAEVGVDMVLPVSVALSHWRLGALARVDAHARASGEAAQVLYHYQSRTDPQSPSSYNVDTDVTYWRGQGLALHAPSQTWGGLKLDMSWDHMRLQRMRDVQTRGMVNYNADGSYTYQGTLRDDDAHFKAPFLSSADSHGVGDALSVALSWSADRIGKAWAAMPDEMSLRLDDVWSSLRWRGVNGNDAILNSNVSTRTPDGYIEYQAAIHGQYTSKTLTERIPMSSQLTFNWNLPSGGQLTSRMKNRLDMWQGWLGWRSAGSLSWRVECEPWAGAALLGLQSEHLSLSVMSGRLDRGAHARGGRLDWAHPF